MERLGPILVLPDVGKFCKLIICLNAGTLMEARYTFTRATQEERYVFSTML